MKTAVVLLILFAVIFALLFYIRMIPAINNEVEFRLDGSFNYRMTKEVLENGDVPSLDRLSTYPEGKNIKEFLPTGMYHACAIFHKLVNRFKTIPLRRSILLFCSFSGALIFFPLYFISYEIYRNKTAAYLTAFLGGIIPAYLNRSLCYWFRYETPSTPMLFMSLLFFIKAFAITSFRKTFIYSLVSALFMTAALYLWRLSILFLICYVIALLYICLKMNKFDKRWLIIIFTVLGTCLLLPWFIPGFGFRNPASDYGTFPKAAVQIILQNIGIRQHFSEFTRLVYYNQELGGVSVPGIFGWSFLSFSGAFAVVFIFSYFFNRIHDVRKEILLIFLIFFTALTFIFSRNKIILGPLVALTLGDTLELVKKNRLATTRHLMVCLIAVIFIVTARDSYKLASTRKTNTTLDPPLKESLNAINSLTPSNAVILCYWSDGYPIQTYCSRPTITDGLFESPEIVRRIIAESMVYYSYNESELLDHCKKYGVTHLLVPNFRKLAYAGYAGVEYGRYYRKGNATDLGRLTNLFKLMYAPNELKRFEHLFRNKKYALYAVK